MTQPAFVPAPDGWTHLLVYGREVRHDDRVNGATRTADGCPPDVKPDDIIDVLRLVDNLQKYAPNYAPPVEDPGHDPE